MSAITMNGRVLEAKTASFKDDEGNDRTYGKIQLLQADGSGDFWKIQNLKVPTDKFGLLPDIAAMKGKTVSIGVTANEYKGKTTYSLDSFDKPKAA